MNPTVIGSATLHLGECVSIMKTIPDNSLDAIISDPPYLINFMGRAFDSQHKSLPGANEGQKMQEWHRRWVTEAYRILKPGGHLAAFGGDRTHHRLMSAMEDVGFELRFNCYWVFGSGFPKSQDASKAIDQHFGMKDKREVVGTYKTPNGRDYTLEKSCQDGYSKTELSMGKDVGVERRILTEPAHPLAKQYSGYGTALKPAVEPICVGRKPMIGTLAENLLTWGTGAMNLDACRVETDDLPNPCKGTGWAAQDKKNAEQGYRPSAYYDGQDGVNYTPNKLGRFPPHLLLDGSDVVKKCFPETSSGTGAIRKTSPGLFGLCGDGKANIEYGDSGSASRFFPSLPYDEEDCATLFYCAKASKRDRDDGCELIEEKPRKAYSGKVTSDPRMDHEQQRLPSRNHHVSVKPTNLMRWLCRLLTPKCGTLLDPFMGSGSTLKAAILENFTCIGIEMDADYFAIAEARVAHVSPEVYVTQSRSERSEVAPRQQSMF